MRKRLALSASVSEAETGHSLLSLLVRSSISSTAAGRVGRTRGRPAILHPRAGGGFPAQGMTGERGPEFIPAQSLLQKRRLILRRLLRYASRRLRTRAQAF